MKPNGPDSESAEGRLGLEGQVPGSVPAEGGDGEGSQYEPSIYEGDDDGERMEEVEYPDMNDIWGEAHGPGEPSALRALHGDDGEPMVVPTNLVGGESRCFSTAQTAQTTRDVDAGATLESMSSSSSTLRASTSRSTPSTFSATSTLGPSSTLPSMRGVTTPPNGW